jgi:hypothetical protein
MKNTHGPGVRGRKPETLSGRPWVNHQGESEGLMKRGDKTMTSEVWHE